MVSPKIYDREELLKCKLEPGQIMSRYGQKMWQIDVDFYNACKNGTVEDLKKLVEQGANPNAPWYNDIGDDFYPIHQAALNPDIEVLKYIVSLGADPCQKDFWCAEPLSYAAREGTLEKIKYLVELGNDPALVDDDGLSVLTYAALNPHIEALDYLLSKGADINADVAMYEEPLFIAIEKGTPERVKYLIEHGAKTSCIDSHWLDDAPLENIRALLECGYDPNSKDEEEGGKVVDHLDESRKALFDSFSTVLGRTAAV